MIDEHKTPAAAEFHDHMAHVYWKQEERGRQRMRWLNSITASTDTNLSKLQEMVKDGEPGVPQSATSQCRTWLRDWTTACRIVWSPAVRLTAAGSEDSFTQSQFPSEAPCPCSPGSGYIKMTPRLEPCPSRLCHSQNQPNFLAIERRNRIEKERKLLTRVLKKLMMELSSAWVSLGASSCSGSPGTERLTAGTSCPPFPSPSAKS